MSYIVKNEVNNFEKSFHYDEKDRLFLCLADQLCGLPKLVRWQINKYNDIVISIVAYAYEARPNDYMICKP